MWVRGAPAGSRKLDVDDRLGGEIRYGGGADVVDPERDVPERVTQPAAEVGEPVRPRRVVRLDPDHVCESTARPV